MICPHFYFTWCRSDWSKVRRVGRSKNAWNQKY